MTYAQTLSYLYSQLPMYHRIGAQAYKADMENTIALCNLLGNPQDSFRSIHVTGTNGKGSVSHMMASILQEAGFKTGLYTSPHLKDFRERIRVNGKMIPKREVSGFIDTYRDGFEPIQPSFFELTVGMAFNHFRQCGVEVAVVEVGLGGRLDSTNIITPLVSVITNVSMDHMQFLGNTPAQIAAEKAGIIKPGIPIVIGETQDEVRGVFEKRARKCRSGILFADQEYTVTRFDLCGEFSDRRVVDVHRGKTACLTGFISPLAGIYQQKNIVTVMGICEELNQHGFSISLSHIASGISKVIKTTGLSGRWQILSHAPLTICDTGHNEGGLREVLTQLSDTPHHSLHFVFGVVNDKELDPVLAMLPQHATYYYCKPDIPRGLDANELRNRATLHGLTGDVYPSVKDAMQNAQRNAGKGDLVFVGGSTFVVAEVV